jgi:hypothetical protein
MASSQLNAVNNKNELSPLHLPDETCSPDQYRRHIGNKPFLIRIADQPLSELTASDCNTDLKKYVSQFIAPGVLYAICLVLLLLSKLAYCFTRSTFVSVQSSTNTFRASHTIRKFMRIQLVIFVLGAM